MTNDNPKEEIQSSMLKEHDLATNLYAKALQNYPFSSLSEARSTLARYMPNTDEIKEEKLNIVQYSGPQPLTTPFTMRSNLKAKAKSVSNETGEIKVYGLSRESGIDVSNPYENMYEAAQEAESSSGESSVDLCYTGDIKIENVDLSIGGRKILEDASFTIVRGRVYGLVGRNGIGKSTVLKALRKRRFGVSRGLTMHLVRQEGKSSNESVIQFVMNRDSDKERIDEDDNMRRAVMILQEVGFDARFDGGLERDNNSSQNSQKDNKSDTILINDKTSTRDNQNISTLSIIKPSIFTPLKNLSGGWSVRASLAKAIFINPDLLLLDEPTNMLDIPTIVWLEKKIQSINNIKESKSSSGTTFLIVSHDREFLDNVCSDILYMDDLKITQYKGNYSQYLVLKRNAAINYMKMYEKQKMDREHLQSFIDRFRYNAKRASLVQSKIKILENMETLKEVRKEVEVRFKFNQVEIKGVLLELNDVGFEYQARNDNKDLKINSKELIDSNNKEITKNSYNTNINNKDEDEKLIANVGKITIKGVKDRITNISDMSVDNNNKIENNKHSSKESQSYENSNDKIQLKPNSIIQNSNKENKAIKRDLITEKENKELKNRDILNHINLKITEKSRIVVVGPNGAGKSTLLKLLASRITPTIGTLITNPNLKPAYFTQHHIDHLNHNMGTLEFMSKEFNVEQSRKSMASFGLIVDNQLISTLSGGQKSRLAFARMSLINPNILLLDEPTNHLDIESIDGLSRGLCEYKGAVICVSHDLRFVESVFEEVWVCKNGRLEYFKGNIRDYRNSLTS